MCICSKIYLILLNTIPKNPPKYGNIFSAFQNIYTYNIYFLISLVAFFYSSQTCRHLTAKSILFLSLSQKHIWYLVWWRKPQACTPWPARCSCGRLKPMLNQSSTARWSTACQTTRSNRRALISSASRCSVSLTCTHSQCINCMLNDLKLLILCSPPIRFNRKCVLQTEESGASQRGGWCADGVWDWWKPSAWVFLL